MCGRQEIDSRLQQIAEVCQTHGVAQLYVFGSVLRDDFDSEKSDIDFMVEFLPEAHKAWLGEFTDLKAAMEAIFGRKVDVIPAKTNRNPYFLAAVDGEKELLYAA